MVVLRYSRLTGPGPIAVDSKFPMPTNSGLGFMAQGLGFRGLGFRGLGFRV